MLNEILMIIAANMLPTSEQIGGIILGITLGLNPLLVFLISIAINCLLFFPVYFGLKLLYNKVFSRMKIFQKYLERVRTKGKPYIDKYGFFGLTLFIALPTPLTGTYTASILAWFLNLEWKKSFFAILVGSVIGAIVIFIGYYGLFNILKIVFGW